MRVRVYPADQWGCGHYRLIWPGQALVDQGHDVTVILPGEGSGIGGVVMNGRLEGIAMSDEEDADVYVFQRPSNIMSLDLIRRLRGRGKTVVVDMDDDLSCIHPRNAAFTSLHPRYSPRNNWQIAVQGCREASLVTVSTPPLLDRYSRFNNARVLRNCIPRRFLDLEHVDDGQPIWGWAGALVSHPDDLPMLGATVAEMNRLGFEFQIIGSLDGTGHSLGLRQDPAGPGAVPFGEYTDHLTKFQLGVAPLNDTKFNRSKSWLKPLEYAACGIPWIASARPEYAELARRGGGIVVGDKSKNWTAAVKRLLTNDAARIEAGQAARAVASEFTIEEHAWRWLETWDVAHRLDQGMPIEGATILT